MSNGSRGLACARPSTPYPSLPSPACGGKSGLQEDVNARDKRGHDDGEGLTSDCVASSRKPALLPDGARKFRHLGPLLDILAQKDIEFSRRHGHGYCSL